MNIRKFLPTAMEGDQIVEAMVSLRRTASGGRDIHVSKRSGRWVVMRSGKDVHERVQAAEDRYLDQQHELAMQKFMSEATV